MKGNDTKCALKLTQQENQGTPKSEIHAIWRKLNRYASL